VPLDIQFLRPLWFLALLPLPWLVWRLSRARGRSAVWRGLVDAHLLEHLLTDGGEGVRRLPLALLALGWLLAVTALAGPAWERLPQPVFQAEAQRVIVLDISAGMNAQDLPPTRLARARFEVLDLLARASEGQTALIAYGAEPFIVSPLTRDAETIAAQVPDLETDLMPLQGAKRTDLALRAAGELLRQAGSLKGDIILITDSLENSAAAEEAAARLRDAGFRTSVLGVGTEAGAPVALPDGGFLTDASGGMLLPRLRPDQLRDLAAAGGGRYVGLSADEADTRALVPLEGRLVEGGAEQDARAEQWRDEGPWLLLALLPLAALAFRRGWLSPLLVILILPGRGAEAFGWDDLWWRADQQGARAFVAGEPVEAAERFRRPDWLAAAQYEAGQYERALETLAGVDGPEAAYNRGNALAHLGSLEEAIQEYQRVLEREPDHADARHNRDLLRRLLEQQRQQQRPQDSPGQQGEQDGQDRQAQDGGGAQGEQDQQAAPGGGEQGQRDQSGQSGPQGADGESDQTAGGGQEGQQQETGQGDQGGQGQAETQPDQGPQGGGLDAEPGDDGPKRSAGASSAGGTEGVDGQDRPGTRTSEGGGTEESGAAGGESAVRDGADPDGGSATGEPGLEDLLGQRAGAGRAGTPSGSNADQGGSEGRQAMEHMLRRVPDDPGGLLRQRFLLQHLRRNGRLP
jgi:Ca-activated chloride channel family protein